MSGRLTMLTAHKAKLLQLHTILNWCRPEFTFEVITSLLHFTTIIYQLNSTRVLGKIYGSMVANCGLMLVSTPKIESAVTFKL